MVEAMKPNTRIIQSSKNFALSGTTPIESVETPFPPCQSPGAAIALLAVVDDKSVWHLVCNWAESHLALAQAS